MKKKPGIDACCNVRTTATTIVIVRGEGNWGVRFIVVRV